MNSNVRYAKLLGSYVAQAGQYLVGGFSRREVGRHVTAEGVVSGGNRPGMNVMHAGNTRLLF